MAKKSIRDAEVNGKRVLIRVDFNVPMDNGTITDDTRLQASLPTIRLVAEKGGIVVLMSHLGRPAGKVVENLRLRPVATRLGELLSQPVRYVEDSVGPAVEAMVKALKPGDVALVENLRFHPEEEKNDAGFSEQLARLGDLYVNDAFGTAHRAHSSTEGVAHLLPAVAGLLMERELNVMGSALSDPKRPFLALIGGAKVSDKIGVLENLVEKVDSLLIGGGMANTFLAAIGCEVGDSLLEKDKIPTARELIRLADKKGIQLMLPRDVVIAQEISANAETRVVACQETPPDWKILDIGPATVRQFSEAIMIAQTVVWNGPMGVFEIEKFSEGTRQIADAVAACKGMTIIGGGDSVAAVERAGLADKIAHISTGGGATLELLEGRILPGVAALQDK